MPAARKTVPGPNGTVYLRPVRKELFGTAAAVVMLLARSAAAQDQPAPPTPPPPPGEQPAPTEPTAPPQTTTTTTTTTTETSTDGALASKESYGGAILVTDLVGYALIGLAAGVSAGVDDVGTNAAGIMAPGVAAYALGGPIVHAVHDNTKGGARSLVARMGLPLAGAAVGGLIGAIATGNDHKSPVNESSGLFWGGVIGAGVGAITATVLDVAIWSHKETRLEDPVRGSSPPSPPPQSIRVVPTFAATPTGGTAGFGGVF